MGISMLMTGVGYFRKNDSNNDNFFFQTSCRGEKNKRVVAAIVVRGNFPGKLVGAKQYHHGPELPNVFSVTRLK